jgi:hypothetical protein
MRFPSLLLRAAFIAALIVIFTLAMIPLPAALTMFSFQDKVEHCGAFAVLMLMGWAAWPLFRLRIAAGLLFYGALIEVCQAAFTTNRVGDPWDWLADSIGVALGLAALRWLEGVRSQGEEASAKSS